MKRTRHKRVPSPRRRALEFIAAHPDGCTEALLAAENIPADILIELIQSGLLIARNERLEDEDGAVETTRLWITKAGRRRAQILWERPRYRPRDQGLPRPCARGVPPQQDAPGQRTQTGSFPPTAAPS
jgi:hypothetical protein